MIRPPPTSPLFPYTPLSRSNHFQTPASLAGSYGTYTFNPTTGAWSYTLNQALADPLTAGQIAHDHLVVTSLDRNSTRLNSSHSQVSNAVSCLNTTDSQAHAV